MSKDRASQWYNSKGDICTRVSEPFESLAEEEYNQS